MKDIFAQRAIDDFFKLANDFADSLKDAFPECADTKDWVLWLKNVVGEDPQKQAEVVENWYRNSNTPLPKGCAKYSKAIQSITESPATMYHAVAYKDAEAFHASHEMLRVLNFPQKLKAPPMQDPANRQVFWQYVSEMTNLAYKTHRATPPHVPTPEAIAENIAQRRAQKGTVDTASSSSSAPPIRSGVRDLWARLAALRGVEAPAVTTKDLGTLAAVPGISEACQQRSTEAQVHLLRAFPALGDQDLSDEQWEVYLKLLNLAGMEAAIPDGMMRGIEDVASKLVRSMEDGTTDLASLDMEEIGKQVLQKVGSGDVSEFASNLDKILPALQRLQK
jgi:hypothetical protein